eukprot:3403077-Lingulodinium_polyedra.AAC.1
MPKPVQPQLQGGQAQSQRGPRESGREARRRETPHGRPRGSAASPGAQQRPEPGVAIHEHRLVEDPRLPRTEEP